jgi:FkbM family methyltransferase
MKLKHALKIIFSPVLVKIKDGPLRGRKWILTTGTRFISGKYEPYKTEAILKNFSKGEIFYDIGAHFGYFSAIAASINEEEGRVFAFEPRPMNAGFFRRHMKANGFDRVTLFESAVGNTDQEVHFDDSRGSAKGRIDEKGNLRVRQVCIDHMVDSGLLPLPTFVKIDVEGGEINVLKGLEKVIRNARPKMVIATHNKTCHDFVLDFLERNNYKYEVFLPTGLRGDTEVAALPLPEAGNS